MNYIEDRAERKRFPPCEILGWSHYNSGVFGSGHHAELNFQSNPTLNPFEQITVNALDGFLSRHDHVVLVDLGAMCGFSTVLIGALYEQEVRSGRLRIVATQQEPDYTIDRLLRESRRRLSLQLIHKQLRQIHRGDLDNQLHYDYDTALLETQLFLTEAELNFMEQHHHAVEFVPSINADLLRHDLERIGITTVHFVHEFNAGLTFATKQRKAAKEIAGLLSYDGGILSTVAWHRHEDSDAYRVWESNTISAHAIPFPTETSDLTYTLFARPEFPET